VFVYFKYLIVCDITKDFTPCFLIRLNVLLTNQYCAILNRNCGFVFYLRLLGRFVNYRLLLVFYIFQFQLGEIFFASHRLEHCAATLHDSAETDKNRIQPGMTNQLERRKQHNHSQYVYGELNFIEKHLPTFNNHISEQYVGFAVLIDRFIFANVFQSLPDVC